MKSFVVFTVFFTASTLSHAEGLCPAGQYQTTPSNVQGPIGCAPIPTSGQQKVAWLDRWGAVATDDDGHWGIVENKETKSRASSAAIDECRKRQGTACKIVLSYKNQCASVASTRSNSGVARAPTKEEAISNAHAICERGNGDSKCGTFYAGCSLPVRIN